MKIVFTGGHFSPALSIIEKLKNDHQVLVIGRKHALEGDSSITFEYSVCQKLDIPFRTLTTGRFQRKLTVHTLPSLIKIPIGFFQAYKILSKYNPDVVVTFGGYLAVPVSLAAYFLKIPIVLHEQTQKAGLSARIIDKVASKVLITFESSRKYFKNKNIILTGNPLRSSILNDTKIKYIVKNPFIYITGGSTGSHFINKLVLKMMPILLEKFTVVHQVGNAKEFDDYNKLIQMKKEMKNELSQKYFVSEFFSSDEVSYFLKNADLVISRAGVNTVLELMHTGSVAILIPLPHGQNDEQKDNAKLYESTGLGIMLEQDQIDEKVLFERIFDMIERRDNFSKNYKNAQKYILLDATDLIIEQILAYGRTQTAP